MRLFLFRQCGKCGLRNIPFGVDWPFWTDGKPICFKCKIEGKLK